MQRLRSLVHKEIGFLCRGQDRVSQREAGSKTGICTSALFLARGKTCSSREAKGLDPKAEHAHLCVCGGLDWAGERLRREVAHHNRESTRLREVTIAAVSGDRDTHR